MGDLATRMQARMTVECSTANAKGKMGRQAMDWEGRPQGRGRLDFAPIHLGGRLPLERDRANGRRAMHCRRRMQLNA
jgi:hypothetical protein